jgi:adenylate kinase
MQERTGMAHISTGDLLRAAVAADGALGRAAAGYMQRGELVPDELVVKMIDERLQHAGPQPGFMLDGFPRTVAQAEALAQLLDGFHTPLDAVVSLEVPRDQLVQRLSGRRTCRACGAMYHVVFDPPARDGVCDRCGGALFQREDDREETIRARLDVYEAATAPLIAYYRDRGLLRAVDGTGSTGAILDRVSAALGWRPAADRGPAEG